VWLKENEIMERRGTSYLHTSKFFGDRIIDRNDKKRKQEDMREERNFKKPEVTTRIQN
jgi:hypothetical protein